ncbi:hypothetical protein GIB67_031386, partial [Kingdonia uniflora]
QQIFHRDLKLENTLLDGSTAPRLKICDFWVFQVVCVAFSTKINGRNTGLYVSRNPIQKEIRREGCICMVLRNYFIYDVGWCYPFEDPEDPRNFRKTIGRILSVHYTISNYV